MTARSEEPAVSVVIPLFNKGPYVETALRSALDGYTSPFEVLVVDDGSTDDGPGKVRALEDPRVRLIRQENAGVSAARNRGLDEARGELVAFLDADDLWLPEYLTSIVRQARAFPDCGLLAAGNYRFTERERVVYPVPGFDAGEGPRRVENFYEFWSRGSLPFWICSCAFRRRWLQEAGLRFPEGESFGEDLDFIFQAAERWPLSFDPRPLTGYRKDVPGQLSRRPDDDTPPYLERLGDRIDRGDVPAAGRPWARRILCLGRLNHANHLLATGRRGAAARQLLDLRLLRVPRYWSRLTAATVLPRRLQPLVLPRSIR